MRKYALKLCYLVVGFSCRTGMVVSSCLVNSSGADQLLWCIMWYLTYDCIE